MASPLFGDAIDPFRVRIHNRRMPPPMQPWDFAMRPDGIHFHISASCHLRTIYWFVHAMVRMPQFAHWRSKRLRSKRTVLRLTALHASPVGIVAIG